MLKRSLFSAGAILAAICGFTVNAAEPWQTIQNLNATQIAAKWQSPPPEYGPEPYYGLNGPVNAAQVERDLDTLKQLGFQAVTVQAGRDMPFAYLSPEYFAFFRTFVQEAKKRDMRIWIVDDAGYPSGFAGGKFSSEKPELRMQAIEIAQKIPVAGGSTVHQALPPETVSAAAVSEAGRALTITLEGNVLDWKAPAGNWTVLIADREFRTSPTRSDTNPTHAKDTTQSLEDYLDPAATGQYLAFTHEQYKRYVGDEFGKTILGFRGDEPDYSISGLPWTPKFFERFKEIKGYDARPFTALFAQTPSRRTPGLAIHLTPEQVRIKADYYDVFSQMFAAGFFKPQGDWCAANNLEYQVHLNHEEMEMELTHSEGSFFRDMKYVQVPGIDAIWHQIWKDTISDYPRLASSVSHVYGRPQAFTETFAAYRPAPDIDMARYILNEQFVRGVNLVEMMYFPATSAGPKPPPSFMADPGFPALATYVRRLSYLTSMGRPDASVALLLPSSSMWMGDDKADTQFVSAERLLSEHQIDFDIIDEDAIARDLDVKPGQIKSMSGNVYRVVILPAPEVLSETVVKLLKLFAGGGGKVIFLGCTPQWLEGQTFRNAMEARPSMFDWATVLNEELPPTPTPPANPPSAPPGPQMVPPDVLKAVLAAAPATVRTAEPDTSMRVMKRRWDDDEMYLLFNEGPKAIHQTISFTTTEKHPQVWDPQSGSITPIDGNRIGDTLLLSLDLAPYEMKVIVVR